jgi:signal transduction histidine kinase
VGRALRPVEAIRLEAESIGGATIHRRLPEPATDDEIGRLARTMNAMLGRLDRSAQRQREFVSDASHELRSPVAAIRTDLEVALHEGDQADWPTVARAVLAEEGRLETLLGDLLVLAADDETAATAGHAMVDMARLAADEVARGRPVPVDLVIDDRPPTGPSPTNRRTDHPDHSDADADADHASRTGTGGDHRVPTRPAVADGATNHADADEPDADQRTHPRSIVSGDGGHGDGGGADGVEGEGGDRPGQDRSGTAALGGDELMVEGVAARLERALANLVDNAARHADGRVQVAVRRDDDRVKVYVDDDGPGIPAIDRERIFERFTRLDGSRARGKGGAGLGLAVVRSIATRHGGCVWAGASPLGGARFTLDLPAARPR